MTKSKYMSREEVLEATGRETYAAVRQLVWRKTIPHRKIAGRIGFLREEIEEWIRQAPGVRLDQVEMEREKVSA